MSKETKMKKPHGKLIWKILCGFFAFLFVFLLIGAPIANNYAGLINIVLGIENTVILDDGDGEVPDRFACEFEDMKDHEANAAMLVERVIAEGAVVLLNRDSDPAFYIDIRIRATPHNGSCRLRQIFCPIMRCCLRTIVE